MRIGIQNGAYFGDLQDTSGLERMKRHGYDAMDFSALANTDYGFYHCDENQFEKEMKEIYQKVTAAGIEIYQTHGPWRYPPQDATEEDRSERFEKMSKAIRATRILGARYFVIHPIMPYGTKVDPEPERFWEMNRDFLTRLTRVGEDNGVVVCLENMPMRALKISTPDQTLRMVKEIDSPWMRFCLDTGHAAVFGISPAEAVRMAGKEYLAVLHVHDNDGERDRHWIPYAGVIDWADFSKALHEIGYEGVMSLETQVGESLHLPPELREYYEAGLARMAKHLAGGEK